MLGTAGLHIREVQFEGHVGPSYVEASDATVRKLVDQFLGVEETKGPRGRPRKRRARGDAGLEKAPGPGMEQAVGAIQRGAGGRLPVYFPRVRLKGSVESIARGITDADNPTGSDLLADVNPTFNWVRLAQRVPVRIRIDTAHLPAGVVLSAGMTATLVVHPSSVDAVAAR